MAAGAVSAAQAALLRRRVPRAGIPLNRRNDVI